MKKVGKKLKGEKKVEKKTQRREKSRERKNRAQNLYGTYSSPYKTVTVIRPTEQHTEVLALAPRLTDDCPTSSVTESVAGVTATSIYVASVK